MAKLQLVELSAATIVAVNNMSLKPGQEQFLAPISYAIVTTVIDPLTAWQRVVLDENDEVVAFVSAHFDPDATKDHLRATLIRINVNAEEQRRGIGRFVIDNLLEETKRRGFHHLDVIYEAGEDGPEQFFQTVGFTPIGETEYGEVIAEISW